MVKLDAVRQSPHNILANSRKARKMYDKAWNAAARAPVFCKITKRAVAGKTKKTYRTHRMIGSHAYMVAASGAASTVANAMEAECYAVREEADPESSRAPWLPQVAKGAKMVLEQFLCALAQEATKKAHAVREGCGTTKRLNRKHMQIGWDVVFENIFSNTAMMPKSMYVALPAAKKPAKKKGEKSKEAEGDDEDYAPADDDDAPAED